ncbi:uncharacterized protein CXorf38-like isoform X3 [Scyliorhinus canicula]|uniref:uncharacterized protein CXorf38-like isoform X3 n=1 Tax=Scyliorhinus canicula TaxID=7830 RepID=UPI0018F7B60E|nr:uncharacterized protein CXorf38-like isoform X3 [Scyliorhinus canicula]
MQSELSIRLNDEGYKNWIKAGFCLQKIRDCLLRFVNTEMEKFHQFLLRTNSVLQRESCKYFCRPAGTNFQRACSLCEEWKRELLNHHTNQNNVIYWGNCSPPLWPKYAWEVAKVYMPRGQANRQGPEKCDVAALLNLINSCDQFDFVERQKVIEIASSDWQVQITETDAVDALKFTDEEINADVIFNAELELIREWMEELCFAVEEQEPLQIQHLNSLNTFKELLKQNKELESVLHQEVEQLYNLEKKLKSGMRTE